MNNDLWVQGPIWFSVFLVREHWLEWCPSRFLGLAVFVVHLGHRISKAGLSEAYLLKNNKTIHYRNIHTWKLAPDWQAMSMCMLQGEQWGSSWRAEEIWKIFLSFLEKISIEKYFMKNFQSPIQKSRTQKNQAKIDKVPLPINKSQNITSNDKVPTRF